MENSSKIKRHGEICKELTEIYIKKNGDYGDSFGKTFRDLGIMSAVTRIYDKMNRIVTLSKGRNNEVLDESLRDSLIDIANYAIMTVMELEEENRK
jgi:hypothetical protein